MSIYKITIIILQHNPKNVNQNRSTKFDNSQFRVTAVWQLELINCEL